MMLSLDNTSFFGKVERLGDHGRSKNNLMQTIVASVEGIYYKPVKE